MTAALMMTACSSDDNDTTEAPVAPSTTKTILYTVTVGGDEATTRATVDSDNKTLRFATGDKLYIWGENIKGVLDITDGIGSTDNATFSGELTYSGSGTPADNLELNATLVSAQQKDGIQISIDKEDGHVEVNNGGENFCFSVNDAVQQYSELTGTSTYGARAFTLTQNTAFLNFEITMNAYPDEEAYAEVYNYDYACICWGDVPIVTEGGVKKAKFVLPVEPGEGNELSNAWVTIAGCEPIPFGADGQVLKAKVYNVKGTVKPTLADALKEGSYVTVYFNHQYGENQSCTFYNTGDSGEDMFTWVEGSGYIGDDGNIGRQLIVDEDDENILIFKQNWGEGYVDIEDNWDENGFQVTFNLETKTYTQWYGPGVAQIYQADWSVPYGPPSFVRLIVNGCDVTSELTESTESE